MTNKFRVEFKSKEDLESLVLLVEESNGDKEWREEMVAILEKPRLIKLTKKKTNATKKAIKARSEQTRQKVEDVVALVMMSGKKISQYNVSKESGVSYVTVQKYLSKDRVNSLNEQMSKGSNKDIR